MSQCILFLIMNSVFIIAWKKTQIKAMFYLQLLPLCDSLSCKMSMIFRFNQNAVDRWVLVISYNVFVNQSAHRTHRCNLDNLIRATRQLSQFSFDWVFGRCDGHILVLWLEIPNYWPIFWQYFFFFNRAHTVNSFLKFNALLYACWKTVWKWQFNRTKIVSYACRMRISR